LEAIIKATYERLVEKKVVVPVEDYTLPPVPEDLNSAIKSGKVQAPTHIVSTICDDRGNVQISSSFLLPAFERPLWCFDSVKSWLEFP
jgi:hypothetical protein